MPTIYNTHHFSKLNVIRLAFTSNLNPKAKEI